MAYKWRENQPLRRVGGDNIQPDEVFEPTDAEKDTFADRMEHIEGADEPDEEEDVTESADAEPQPNYSEMDYAELRQLAKGADTDEINGRSKKAEIIDYFEE